MQTHSDIQQTQIVYASLDPKWNACLNFRIIDDEDLQEKFFEIIVMDQDNFVKDKPIGSVNIDLSPLLSYQTDQLKNGYEGWFPIYHHDRGLLGDLQVQVKIELIKDENETKFISSTDVEFFCQTMPPPSQIK